MFSSYCLLIKYFFSVARRKQRKIHATRFTDETVKHLKETAGGQYAELPGI
jgi:hypothetical protein